MSKYINNKTGKVAEIISKKAAGMCSKTLGLTMVVYRYGGDSFDYPLVMESGEFHEKHFVTNTQI
jgi:hypothetical protein